MSLTSHIPQIKKLCERHKVEKLYAFGSVLTDRFNENSDVDFVYRFRSDVPLLDHADNYFDFKFSLEYMFNRPVDLVAEKQQSNPYFIEEVNATKQLIYG